MFQCEFVQYFPLKDNRKSLSRRKTRTMTSQFSRRAVIRGLAGAAAAGIVARPLQAAIVPQARGDQPTGQERGEMGRISGAFRRQFSVPALSVAISRNAQFVYDNSGGMADKEHALQVSQSSLFRIAGVTKPITSVTIFILIEKGKLNLTDKVFGPSGIFGNKYGKPPSSNTLPTSPSITCLHTPAEAGPTAQTIPCFSTIPGTRQTDFLDTRESATNLSPRPALGLLQFRLLLARPRHRTGFRAGLCGLCSGEHSWSLRNHRHADRAEFRRKRAPNEVVYYGQYGENPYKINVTRMDHAAGSPRRRAWCSSSITSGSPPYAELSQARDHPHHDYAASRISNTNGAANMRAAGWSAIMARETGGTAAVCRDRRPLWFAPRPDCAGRR